jgi:RHS repeat-associated protein
MRTDSTLTYFLSDHLGSTSLTADASGNFVSELRYKPWGETRSSSGATATNYRYTGQREESSFGLYFYNARWMDPQLGRFIQADTIVPGGVQGLDRYAYVNNSPVNYTDPTGHICKDGDENIWGYCQLPTPDKVKTYQNAYLNAIARKFNIKLAVLYGFKNKNYIILSNL